VNKKVCFKQTFFILIIRQHGKFSKEINRIFNNNNNNSIELTKEELEFLMVLNGLSVKIDTLESMGASEDEIEKAKKLLEKEFQKTDLTPLWENVSAINLSYKS